MKARRERGSKTLRLGALAGSAMLTYALTGCVSPVSYHPESLRDAPPAGGKVEAGTRGNAQPASGGEQEPAPTSSAAPSKQHRLLLPCAVTQIGLPESWTLAKKGTGWSFTIPSDEGGGELVVTGQLLGDDKAITDGDKLGKELQDGKTGATVTTHAGGLIRATLKTQQSGVWRLGQIADDKTEIVTLSYAYSAESDPDAAVKALDQATQNARLSKIGDCPKS